MLNRYHRDKNFKFIHECAILGKTDLVKQYIASGKEIDLRDSDGKTPLHYAVESGHKDIAEMLIKNGANVNNVTKGGQIPLHVVYKSDLAKLLLNNGSNVNVQDIDGNTPLHCTIHNAGFLKIDTIKEILKHNPNVNIKNNWSATPLHNAIYTQNVEVVKLIIEKSPDMTKRDKSFRTPLSYANQMDKLLKSHQSQEIVHLLAEYKRGLDANKGKNCCSILFPRKSTPHKVDINF